MVERGDGWWGRRTGDGRKESRSYLFMFVNVVQDYDWRQYASADDDKGHSVDDDHSLRTRLASHLPPTHSPPTLPDTVSAPFEDTLSGSMVSNCPLGSYRIWNECCIGGCFVFLNADTEWIGGAFV